MAKYVHKMMILRWPFIWSVYNQEGPLPIFLAHEELYFWKLWSIKYNTDPALYYPWVRGAVEVTETNPIDGFFYNEIKAFSAAVEELPEFVSTQAWNI